jgi:hypothetical protein
LDLEGTIQHNFKRLETKLNSNFSTKNEEITNEDRFSEGKNENILNLLKVLQTKMLLKVKEKKFQKKFLINKIEREIATIERDFLFGEYK